MYPAVQKEEEGSIISQDTDNSPWCCCWVWFCFCSFTFACTVSLLLHGLFSSCCEWGLLFFAVCRLLIAVASVLLWSTGSRARGLQYLWHMGLVALQRVASSQTRNQTCVSCVGRRILNQWAIREGQQSFKLEPWCTVITV